MYTEDRVYHHRVEMIDGKKHYFISFVDVHGDKVSQEVSFEVYEASNEAQRNEARIARSDRRHMEHIKLSDNEIETRAVAEHDTVEKDFFHNESTNAMVAAINSLPLIQRRRTIRFHIEGIILRDIAAHEGCSAEAVHYSIKRAEKKIKEKLKKFLKET